MKSILAFSTVLFSCFSFTAFADIDCRNADGILEINNDEVLEWKETTENQFEARAHVLGTLSFVYPNKNGHDHFQIQIGSEDGETIEVVYNKSFGALPELELNMEVEACGDYITSIAPAGPYPASPDGAIMHWVHGIGKKPTVHLPGFVKIDGDFFGLHEVASRSRTTAKPKKSKDTPAIKNEPKTKKKNKKATRPRPRPRPKYDDYYDAEDEFLRRAG